MNGWIDVRDKLPDEDSYVIIATLSGLTTSTFFSSYLRKTWDAGLKLQQPSCYFQYAAQYGYTVTHWMPLPEAPSVSLRHSYFWFLRALVKTHVIKYELLDSLYGEGYHNPYRISGNEFESIFPDRSDP